MLTPIKAIRAKCLDCCCGSANEVKQCPCKSCSLHPFRFGKNPYRKAREYTPEEREAIAARLSKNRPYNTGEKSHQPAAEGIYITDTQNAAESCRGAV